MLDQLLNNPLLLIGAGITLFGPRRMRTLGLIVAGIGLVSPGLFGGFLGQPVTASTIPTATDPFGPGGVLEGGDANEPLGFPGGPL